MYNNCPHKNNILEGYIKQELDNIEMEETSNCEDCKNSSICSLWLTASFTVDMQYKTIREIEASKNPKPDGITIETIERNFEVIALQLATGRKRSNQVM